jgi:protein involved in polysaccharide export with SLBB domain
MQPAKLGAAAKCLLTGVLLLGLCSRNPASAQTPTPVLPPLVTQQQTNEKIRSLSDKTPTPPHDYVIGRGDLVSVEVFDVPELSRDLRVSQTGTIGIPLVPVRLSVTGLTELQLQQKITEVLEANGLVSHPQVLVSVKEKKSQPITIVGAVAHPMVYQADHPVTLVQILAEVGGVSADAGDTIIITRPDTTAVGETLQEPPEIGVEDAMPATNPAGEKPVPEKQAPASGAGDLQPQAVGDPEGAAKAPVENSGAAPPAVAGSDEPPAIGNTITVNIAELLERGETRSNIPLKGGDIVTVPHAGIVYALGAVIRPGGYVSTNDRAQLSTLKVLALAGGMTRIAKKDKAVIIRKDALGKQMEIPVDLGKIIERKSEDVRLLPSDILYVPDNIAKAVLIRSGELAVSIGSAMAIYRLGSGF